MLFKFKTTINCGNCVNLVKNDLNLHPAIQWWKVDTAHPDKILEMETQLSANEVTNLLLDLGFEATLLMEA